ncbi:MAG: ACP S-malonyltransferase [Candidatus Caenarcaniphilales bacterium]|jgi:[acyl-carrier-protein] S-malonyltransferase|nr:ACP S-malonyltransferase [Candidatus Caenarcaniphilales bacterium]
MAKTVLVFPGQGSQQLGMGKEFYEANNEAKAIFDLADKLFSEYHPNEEQKLSDLIFNGPEDKLNNTKYTQVAILTLSMALFNGLRNQINITAFAGHSLGEFSALYAAGVLNEEAVLKLVIKRADLMSQAKKGAMSAVIGLSAEQIEQLCSSVEGAWIANYNSPDQIVCTGTIEGMQNLAEKITAFASANSLRARVIPLAVSGAFHSQLMQEASTQFAAVLDATEFKNASFPVIQNIDAKGSIEAKELKEKLKLQMTGSVRWTHTVQEIFSMKAEQILEIGPGKVLAGLIKKQDKAANIINIDNQATFVAFGPMKENAQV